MRLFLLLALVLIGTLLWRSIRAPKASERQTPPRAEPQPQDMVTCALCGMHLPQTDAVQGQRGLYCSAEHRQRAEA